MATNVIKSITTEDQLYKLSENKCIRKKKECNKWKKTKKTGLMFQK